MLNDLNLSTFKLSISIWQSPNYLPITIHIKLPHNMAAADTTIDRFKFSDMAASCLNVLAWLEKVNLLFYSE